MSEVKQISNFQHNFLMVAGGAQCLLGAIWNAAAVRPAKAIYARLTHKPAAKQGGFFGDLLGPDLE